MTGIGTQIKNALGWFLTRLKGNVVNNLTSTSTDLPLSAAKGKDLQDQITSLNTNISIEETQLVIAAPNVDVNHAYATKIKKKIYACHGYIKCTSTITAGTRIFITGNLLNYSSLLLIGSTQQGYGNLIFENGYMTLANTNLPAGYYYVCGIIVEE